ncbi:unnamed protein product [Nesidiocoris tenuis]|uniref:Uncharacterized protein n=1 Tax=Nesidiocoris tenuis TaxID=355587 RepID=A0A6H5FUS6_9HEMI|nr:unnamed protein product [Nesidiocoris tenuis]
MFGNSLRKWSKLCQLIVSKKREGEEKSNPHGKGKTGTAEEFQLARRDYQTPGLPGLIQDGIFIPSQMWQRWFLYIFKKVISAVKKALRTAFVILYSDVIVSNLSDGSKRIIFTQNGFLTGGVAFSRTTHHEPLLTLMSSHSTHKLNPQTQRSNFKSQH